MLNIIFKRYVYFSIFISNIILKVYASSPGPVNASQNAGERSIKTTIVPPTITQILEFVIRGFFALAALAAILYLLLGAFSWITSSGNKENIEKAREKIQAAVLGLIIILVVLTLVVLVENIFNIGLGVSRAITIPTLQIQGIQ